MSWRICWSTSPWPTPPADRLDRRLGPRVLSIRVSDHVRRLPRALWPDALAPRRYLYSSADDSTVEVILTGQLLSVTTLSVTPPVSSTVPSASSVAVCEARAAFS